jgi:hypothetical protein
MLAKGVFMKSVSFIFCLLALCCEAHASIEGLTAEREILRWVANGAEIKLRWEFPGTRDSFSYFQIANCEFPPDSELASQMMEKWWQYKVSDGLEMKVDKDYFLQFQEKMKTHPPDYMQSNYLEWVVCR